MSCTPTNRTVRAESYCRQSEEYRGAAPTRHLVVGAVLPVDAGALLPHRLEKLLDVDSSSAGCPHRPSDLCRACEGAQADLRRDSQAASGVGQRALTSPLAPPRRKGTKYPADDALAAIRGPLAWPPARQCDIAASHEPNYNGASRFLVSFCDMQPDSGPLRRFFCPRRS